MQFPELCIRLVVLLACVPVSNTATTKQVTTSTTPVPTTSTQTPTTVASSTNPVTTTAATITPSSKKPIAAITPASTASAEGNGTTPKPIDANSPSSTDNSTITTKASSVSVTEASTTTNAPTIQQSTYRASAGDSYDGVEAVAGVSIVLISVLFIAIAAFTSRFERLKPKLDTGDIKFGENGVEMNNIHTKSRVQLVP